MKNRKFLVMIHQDRTRDAQIDIHHDEEKEKLCSEGYENEDQEDEIYKYENREWRDFGGDISVGIFFVEEGESFDEKLDALLKLNDLNRELIFVYELSDENVIKIGGV